MTEVEYRMHPAISRSELFKISESPEKFKYYKDNPEEPTPALIFGQLLHKMVLQPETLLDEFAKMPNVDRRTKAGKEEYSEFVLKSVGKTIVTSDQYAKAIEMSTVLYSNPYVMKLLAGEKEVPYFWTDEDTGEECKCRADCITTIGNMPMVIDLKTASCADNQTFTREAIKYGYEFQAAMYLDGIDKCTGTKHGFVFIVIEKDPPYAVNIFQADDLFIKHGYDLFREYIGIYHDCKTTGNWYGYLGKFDNVNNLSLPAWLAKEVE